MMVGKVVVLTGALLEIRHLVAAVSKHFEDCPNLWSAIARVKTLDDATLIGMIVCGILGVAIVVTILGELGPGARH